MNHSRKKHAHQTSSNDSAILEGEIPTIENLIAVNAQRVEEDPEVYDTVKHNLSMNDIDTHRQDVAASGEESVGGHAPTPDQDIVAELGEAAGIEFQDNQPLHTHEEVWAKRDRHRWELDRRSADDASS